MHNVKYFRLLFMSVITICSCLWPLLSYGAGQPEYYARWMKLPSDSLLEKGRVFANDGVHADSALTCFTILVNRYSDKLPKKEKYICARGYSAMCFVYFFEYFDYSKALESLGKADEISRSIGVEMPQIYMNYGHVYSTIGDQNLDRKSSLLGIDYMLKAFRSALKVKDWSIVNTAFGNTISASYKLGKLDMLAEDWEEYEKTVNRNTDSVEFTKFNIQLYKSLKLMTAGRYKAAIKIFDDVIAEMPLDVSHIRYTLVVLEYKAEAYSKMGNYAKAVDCMLRMESLSKKFEVKDAFIEIYRILAGYYKQLGQLDKMEECYSKYFRVKDEILNYMQAARINEMKFLGEMRNIEAQMEAVKQKAERQRVIMLAVGIVALIVFVSTFIVVRKNKKLLAANRSLYDKNVEIIKSEEEERKARKQYEHQLSELRSRLSALDSPGNEAQVAGNEAAYDGESRASTEKYKNSNLDDDDKAMLIERIRNVMEDTDSICSNDFSAERLASLVGSKYKYVSQVINETFGCNFSTFLNNYRIKEACRRISDIDKYGHLTIEAISESVGFKSRSTFVTQFKRVTGLTPSEYQKMTRSDYKQ